MSDRPSAQAQSNTKTDTDTPATNDKPSLSDPEQVLEQLQKDLVKGGVRRDEAVVLARQVISYVSSYHSGPLPSVRTFAGYEEICPGAARDILDMAKNDQAHRARMEKGMLRGDIFLQSFAIAAAFGIICVMVFGAVYAASIGHESVGITIATGSGFALVAGAVAKILFGKRRKESPEISPKPGKKRR